MIDRCGVAHPRTIIPSSRISSFSKITPPIQSFLDPSSGGEDNSAGVLLENSDIKKSTSFESVYTEKRFNFVDINKNMINIYTNSQLSPLEIYLSNLRLLHSSALEYSVDEDDVFLIYLL
jgi:hypothetical protein